MKICGISCHDFSQELGFRRLGGKQLEDSALLMRERARLNFLDVGWMSANARKRTAQKAANMGLNIGIRTSGPDVRSPQSLADYCKSINITSNMFDNKVSGIRHRAEKKWQKLTRPVDRSLADALTPMATQITSTGRTR